MKSSLGFAILSLVITQVSWASNYSKEFSIEIDESDNGGRVQSFMWGAFKVVFYDSLNDEASVTILGPKGDVLKTMKGPGFITPALFEDRTSFVQEFFMPLFKDKMPILKITTWSGGAYGYYTDHLFAQYDNGTVKNLLTYEGGEARIGKAIDKPYFLSADGTPNIILVDFGVQKIGALQHGASTRHVLTWDGKRFKDNTAIHKNIPLEAALGYKKEIKGPITSIDANLEVALIGFLANSILAGEETGALLWLKEKFETATDYEGFKKTYLQKIRMALSDFEALLN